MQATCRSLILRSGNGAFTAFCRQATRSISTGDRVSPPRAPGPPSTDENDGADNLFSPENIKDLSPVEVARMRVTYGLLKEHIQAMEQNLAVDPETNPMIDPRSFDIKKLPKLPKELLEQFRKELPPDVAATSRLVSTQGIWEALRSGESEERSPELRNQNASEWAIIDEQTMDPKQFSRMQRQSFTATGDIPFRSDTASVMRSKRKKTCPLQDERGRVKVDFRAVGTLMTYLSEGGKIFPKRKTGLSAKAQRKVARAIKTARTMALIHPEPRARLTYEELLEIERNLK